MRFQRVQPRKVSAIAAEQILAAIERGDYPVGSRLPSEFDLALQMGVSRPSIREALSALQAMGVVESKPGSGNYILRTASTADQFHAVGLMESEASCLEVMDARGALEPAVAALAAQKADESAVVRLREAIERMRQLAAANDFEAYFEADRAFHEELSAGSGNPLIASALAPLIATMGQTVYRKFTRHYYLKNVSDLQHVVDLHQEILDAVEKADAETARAKMEEHWARMREIWEA
ncbi:MAG: FadR/GntR family transcriptional regulator [Candidatus Bipolaricaulota bacterium]